MVVHSLLGDTRNLIDYEIYFNHFFATNAKRLEEIQDITHNFLLDDLHLCVFMMVTFYN